MKSYFSTHNIFSKNEGEILSYLDSVEHDYLILEEAGEITGFTFLVNFGQNADGPDKLWKFRHFAFASEQAGAELLKQAEEKVSKLSDTAKIELTIAEREKEISFYESNGYKEEAELSNHYRFGETCFIFGKSIEK